MRELFVLSCIAERQSKMKIRQIRNATLRINFGGVEFLIDPWLISKSEGFTFGQSPFASEVVDPTQLDIVMPMRELPMPLPDVLSGVESVCRAALERRGLAKRVLMPDDGEVYMF